MKLSASLKKWVLGLFVFMITVLLTQHITTWRAEKNISGKSVQKPLYWVAPMDSSYRRKQAGKSPMGMDLIPVYQQKNAADNTTIGSIKVTAEVINQLGVRTKKAVVRALNTEITTVGYVQYDEDQLVHIHPRVEGWVERLFVKSSGDPVKKGEPLYALYSPQLVNAQEELLLALRRNNLYLVQAAENRLRALQIDTSVIEQLKRERKVQQTITFYVPKTGVVDKLNIREGFFVKPDTTLLSVATLNDVWVEAEIFERQAALVEVGLPVTMSLDYLPGKQWSGTIDYVYPVLDAKTRTARVRVRFKNTDRLLKPNMFAQIKIQIASEQAVLVVPREAVIRTGSQNRLVLALGKGKFKSITVKLGRIEGDYAQVLSGLSEGQRVVTSAQFLLDSESNKITGLNRFNLAGEGKNHD